MKELNSYDRANAAFLNVITPEWRQVKAARSATTPVRAPDVAMPLRFQTIAGRKIRIAEAGPTDAPVVVLLSPFPLSILTFAPAWTALTATVRVLANLDSPAPR